jgi:hypothetical protein
VGAVLCRLGFQVVREGKQIALRRARADGGSDTLTVGGHRTIKAATLRTILTRGGITREDFLRACEQS